MSVVLWFIAVSLFVILTAGIASAATVTQNISYSGNLTNTAGTPLTGTYTVTFKLYNVATGGSVLAIDTHSVTATKGQFTTTLQFPPALFNGQGLWLGIQRAPDPEKTPRTVFYPVPYALSLRPGATLKDTVFTASSAGTGYNNLLPAVKISTMSSWNPGVMINTFGFGSKGIYVITKGQQAAGVHAIANGPQSNAIVGETSADGPAAVAGVTSGNGSYGLYAKTTGKSSAGVHAVTSGPNSNGVDVLTTNSGSKGIYVITNGQQAAGVHAIANGPQSNAIVGETSADGPAAVAGITSGNGSYGLYAKTTGKSSAGVHAVTSGPNSNGVDVFTTNSGSKGVYAITSGPGSTGIYTSVGGANSKGVDVLTTKSDSIGVNVITRGDNSKGVNVQTSGLMSNGISISTNNLVSTGLYVDTHRTKSDGVSIQTDGDISDGVLIRTNGNESHGVNAFANGEKSYGIYARSVYEPAIYAMSWSGYGLETPNRIYAMGSNFPTIDVAEYFPVEEGSGPGMVMVIGPAGSLQPASLAYDTRVAGIISTAPGVSLGTKKEGNPGEQPIAVAGRVPCKVDATKAPIHAGDLLTTSDNPGYAMKAEPIEISGRTFYPSGIVLGKAIGSLESGTGTIEVLVTLQ